MERIVVPPNQTQVDGCAWACGTAAGTTDIVGQRAVLTAWRDSEGTGDCPLGRASALSGSDAPVLVGLIAFILFNEHNRRGYSGLLLGLVHRFWTILGGILAGSSS